MTEEWTPEVEFAPFDYSVAHHLPEPADLAKALPPPATQFFKEGLSVLQTFIAEAEGDWQATAKALALAMENILVA